MRFLLYDISPQNPKVVAEASIFVLLVAVAASIGPILDAVSNTGSGESADRNLAPVPFSPFRTLADSDSAFNGFDQQ
jgi:hypothetical protein